jgi:hypothetical protein
MGLNLYVVLGSAVVGLLVGLTGAGGGALGWIMGAVLLAAGGYWLARTRTRTRRPWRNGWPAAPADSQARPASSPAGLLGSPAHPAEDLRVS